MHLQRQPRAALRRRKQATTSHPQAKSSRVGRSIRDCFGRPVAANRAGFATGAFRQHTRMSQEPHMRDVCVSDVTMREAAASKTLSLSFKEKLEIVKILDRIGVGSIEVEGIESPKVDALRIKSIASLVKNSTLAVPVKMDDESIEAVWSAAKGAACVRLQVEAAVSPSCMEYIQHRKADALIADAAAAVAKCKALTDDVEFVAIDATRTDVAYLARIIDAVAKAGATTVTVCDAAGAMLPENSPGSSPTSTMPRPSCAASTWASPAATTSTWRTPAPWPVSRQGHPWSKPHHIPWALPHWTTLHAS